MSTSLDAARRSAAARLREAGIESPELDARLLLGFVTALDLTALITQGARVLTAEEGVRLDELLKRRIAGEPVARIVGTKEFWGLDLTLSPDTLVPRPDTETLVQAALDHLRAEKARAVRIADLGTGSGAILLALLSELPDAIGIATDISIDALRTARTNARRLGLDTRVSFVACDYAAALTGDLDLIVSNPPYIRAADIDDLAVDVRNHDPRRALDGGIDGLDAYRAIAKQAVPLLNPDGALIVEVGHDLSEAVTAIFAAAGLTTDRPVVRDLAGIARVVIGRKLP